MRSAAFSFLAAFAVASALGLAPAPASAQACTDGNGTFRFLNEIFPPPSTNTEFVGRLVVVNADGPVTFSVDPTSPDPLPPGLTLDPDSGFITGIPDQAQSYDVEFRADDGVQTPVTKTINFSVNAAGGGGNAGSEISNNVFPDGRVGTVYAHTLVVTNGVGPFTFGASELPPGLSLNGATGEVSGAPTAPGTWFASFTVYDDGENNIANTVLPIRILPFDPLSDFAFVTRFLNNGEVGTPYCDQYEVENAGGAVTFGASGLPAGLTLDPATGAVTGTPTVAGTFLVTLSANDGSNTITTNLSMLVAPGSSSDFHWNFFGLPAGLVNTLYDREPPIAVSAEGATGAVSYAATGLPPGIDYAAGSGELSGTPTQVGEYPVTLTATDAGSSEVLTLDLVFIVLPATGGDVSQISVNLWVSRASLRLGEDGGEAWRVSALYNADRRTGTRLDAAANSFLAKLGGRELEVAVGEFSGDDQAMSYASANGDVPSESVSLNGDRQSVAWSTGSDTFTETVPGVLAQTVRIGDRGYRLLLRFDARGGFRPALGFERTAFVLSRGSIRVDGPGSDSAKLTLLLADPNFSYEGGVSTLRLRILDGATVLMDRDFTALGGPAKQNVDSNTGKLTFAFRTLSDDALTDRVSLGYSSSKGAMKLSLSGMDLTGITDGEAHLGFELTIGSRVYTTYVTFFEGSPGSYRLAIP